MRSRSLPKKANGCGSRVVFCSYDSFSVAPRLVERTSIAVLARLLGATRFCVRNNMCV